MDRADFDVLLDDAIKTAAHFLSKSGEFFPFALAKTSDGEVRHVQVMTENDRPTSKQVVDILLPKLTEAPHAGLYVVVAIVTNVDWTDTQTGEKSDAIRIELEGLQSDPITCFLPYHINRADVELGEIRATAGQSTIFPDV